MAATSPRSRVIRNIAVVMIVLGSVAFWLFLNVRRVPIPKRDKLTDCTSDKLSFTMPIQYRPPHQFLLGVPLPPTEALSFHGEIRVSHQTGLVARISISSDDITGCNWLDPRHRLAGFILTWSQTNAGQRLSDVLVRGQTYDVQVTFSKPPPKDSSLWLSSVTRPFD